MPSTMIARLRRRAADLTHSYEPRHQRSRRALADPMAAARARRREEEKAAREREEADRKQRALDRDPSRGEPTWRRARKLTTRGFAGYGGGAMHAVDIPPMFRATTVQAAGINPWVIGDAYPKRGAPLGVDMSGRTFNYDPISATYLTRQQNTPSTFILGLPSLGKSTVARKLVSSSMARGHIPFVFADTKPDFAKEIEILGGQVIKLGHGEGYLNPLAVGALGSIIPLLSEHPDVQSKVIKQVHQRRKRLVRALCEMEREEKLTIVEKNILDGALIALADDPRFDHRTPPLLSDLVEIIESRSPVVMRRARTKTEDAYDDRVDGLLQTLSALLDGDLGEVFSQQTTTPIDLVDNPPSGICVDISGVNTSDTKLEAAVMLACWEDGFGAIEAAHILADCGLRPQRLFLAVLDELWRVLGSGPGMVARINELTRLTRTLGTALVMITHTVKDLESLEHDFDIAKAKGFIERAGALIVGALPRSEMDKLDAIVPFTSADRQWVASLATPAVFDPITEQELPPPGRGHFLLRLGTERVPGYRFRTTLTPTELHYDWHDTNARFTAGTAPRSLTAEVAA
ncbi:hypothetical protein [Rhodococcus rhodnii]|uniref:hypothetical protein n=1 Tax=Rhodococcus rhodnii TaxID=38312 RepID=UPI000A8C4DF2|nr:hypothetical protein [Rhodococcus rhodnii]